MMHGVCDFQNSIREIMADKTPKVSVCVVTYNQEKYINECLQSILDQKTDFLFEVIVSDDCSTDGTALIIEEFSKKYPSVVKVVSRRKNVGAVENFISVHNLSKAEFVSHCDGDDIFLPGKLQKQVDYLNANPDCTVTWHRVNSFDDQGNFFPGELGSSSIFENGVVTFSQALRFGTVGGHSTIMYRRSARKTTCPGFDVLDLFYSWEYLSSGWGVILDDVLGEYRVNSNGAVSKSTHSKIRALNAHHSEYYLRRYPERRADIFIFAFTNFLIDVKNRRKTAIDFLILMLRSFSFISPIDFVFHLRKANKLRVPVLSEKRK